MKFWHGKKVVVTGAGGFIGSHLTQMLIKSGADVKTIIHYNSRHDYGMLDYLPQELINELEIIQADLRDESTVRSFIKDTSFVFHLGALIAIPYSYQSPMDFIQTNVLGTTNVLNACRNTKECRLIHTSTSEVYGTANYIPIDENHPLTAQSPYSASKIAADKIVESFHLSYDLETITIRPFNNYGPRQSARAIIPTIISQAILEETIKLGSLQPLRDLNYVEDISRGFLMLGATSDCIGKTINLGTGKSISIGQLAEVIMDIMAINKEIISDSKRVRPEKSEVSELVADASLAEELTGWKPEVSLREGLKNTIEWIEQNIMNFKTDHFVM